MRPTKTHRGLLVRAIDPKDGTRFDALIPHFRIQWARTMGEGAIRELAYSVQQVLLRPHAVFEGVRRDADDDSGATEGWLCYIGTPEPRYEYRTGQERSRGRRVMLVYLNDERTVYLHRWEEESEEHEGLPKDMKDRFRRRAL